MSIQTHLTKYDYYDLSLEEDMPESQPQINLSDLLKSVLKQHYILQGWFVTGNLAIFPPTPNDMYRYLAPDIALFKGVVLSAAEQRNLSSWRMAEPNRPAPTVVFEISSKETWPNDLDPKPHHYGHLGVREYFAYDPQHFWQNATTQLRGWRYPNGIIEEIQPNETGWLWSDELDSWLVPDGEFLRLYDPNGNQRLTLEEAADEQKESAKRQEKLARRRENAAKRRAEMERAAKEAERAEKEAALAAKEAALQREQALLEKLRKANIDIDSLR